MYDIAIIGGMGPAATAELFERIVRYTSADVDQEHIKLCILNDPTIPDRTSYLLSGGESPLPKIKENIDAAKLLGCKYFAISCNTSHYFYRDYESVDGIKFINMIYEACRYVSKVHPSKKICVLATKGTVSADVYKKIGGEIAEIVYPSDGVNSRIMQIIESIKAGKTDLQAFSSEILTLVSREYDVKDTVFMLACTELSLLLPYLNESFIDAMDVLSGVIIAKCQKKINDTRFGLCRQYFSEELNKE